MGLGNELGTFAGNDGVGVRNVTSDPGNSGTCAHNDGVRSYIEFARCDAAFFLAVTSSWSTGVGFKSTIADVIHKMRQHGFSSVIIFISNLG